MMTMDKFTIKAQDAVAVAQQKASENNHQQIEPEHILKAMLGDAEGIVSTILKKAGINLTALEASVDHEIGKFPKIQGGIQQIYLSQRSQQLVNNALKFAGNLKDEYVSTEHLLLAMAQKDNGNLWQILNEMGLEEQTIMLALREIRGSQRVTDQNPEGKYQALQRYGRDLNELARLGKLDPVIIRYEVTSGLSQVLSRRTKNNPVLIGEPGVGNTAIAEGLAHRIIDGDVPDIARP